MLMLERRGWINRTPAFIYDYNKDYPAFKLLEENAEAIKKECLKVLEYKEHITDIGGLDGKNKTKGGVHAIKWKTFMLKSGRFIGENCDQCPETARLLRKTPRVKQAFFSILDPNQYIKPHKGYYQGFLRYHLGLIIPDNNLDKSCWIRINDDIAENKKKIRDVSMEGSEKYFWKEGEGIMFNDNYLHEASNESDKIRVVLFIDVVRKFPFWLDWFNRLLLTLAYQTKQARNIAKNAVVKIPAKSET